MISQTADHALRAVLCLAARPGTPLTAQQVGEEAGVSGAYLSKILQTLGKGGIVSAQRGLRGGFVLNVPAERLTLLEVIQAIDPSRRVASCPAGDVGAGGLCPLHRRLDAAAAEAERVLAAVSVADVLVELNGQALHAGRLVNHG